jgi:hypothetical protein
LDFIWQLTTNFKVHYHHQLDWSVNLSLFFNHPRGYMLLKTNEDIAEAGLATRQASQIEPSSILAPGYADAR